MTADPIRSPRTVAARLATAVLLPGFVGPTVPDWLAAELADGLAGVCLFATNVRGGAQVRALTAALRSAGGDPIVAVDEEGGDVSRVGGPGGSPAPGNAYLGRVDDITLTRTTMAAIGDELHGLGITMDLAPVADINSNPRNPVIGVRSFGADTDLVARHVAAAVTGLQRAGVGAVAKHFPGHGDTAVDSHVGLPTLDAERDALTRRELRPFAAAIDAGVAAIMTAHLVVPALDPKLPASLSPSATRVLRDDLGFGGLIVTDALDMQGASGGRGIPEAAVQALVAGAQLLCLGTRTPPALLDEIRAAVEAAVGSGRLPLATLQDAADAVRAFRRRFPGTDRTTTGPTPTGATPTTPHPEVGGSGLVVRRAVPAQRRPLVVRFDGYHNHAAGAVPWGIGEHLRPQLDDALPGAEIVAVSDPATLDALLRAGNVSSGRDWVVLIRNAGRLPVQAEAVARIRAVVPHAVVVEMGWPGDDELWDVASYGAGRAVSLAVARMLGQGVAP